MAHAHGHSPEDYLEAIYFLVSPIGEYQPADGSPANAARVADMLGVSRAAAGEMLERLDNEGCSSATAGASSSSRPRVRRVPSRSCVTTGRAEAQMG